MSYRTKEFDGDYRRQPKTDRYCTYCQKDIKPESRTRSVYIVEEHMIHPDDKHLYEGDVGTFIVGLDCARTIGMEWTVA